MVVQMVYWMVDHLGVHGAVQSDCKKALTTVVQKADQMA